MLEIGITAFLRIIAFLALLYLGAFLCRIVRIPPLFAEVVIGILFGPHVVNLLNDGISDWFSVLGYFGLLLLVFETGLNVNPRKLFTYAPYVLVASSLGLGVSVGGSFLFAFACKWEAYPVGLSLAILSIPSAAGISFQLLHHYQHFHSDVGQVVVYSVILADTIAIISVHAVQVSLRSEVDAWNIIYPIFFSVVFVLGTLLLSIHFFPRLYKFLQGEMRESNPIVGLVQNSQRAHLLLMVGVITLYTWVGVSFESHLLGPFMAGVTFSLVPNSIRCWAQQSEPLLRWLIRLYFGCSFAGRLPIHLMLQWSSLWKGLIFGIGPLGLGKLCSSWFLGTPYRWMLGIMLTARGDFTVFMAQLLRDLKWRNDTTNTEEAVLPDEVYAVVVWGVLWAALLSLCLLDLKSRYAVNKKKGIKGDYRTFTLQVQAKAQPHTVQLICDELWRLGYSINTIEMNRDSEVLYCELLASPDNLSTTMFTKDLNKVKQHIFQVVDDQEAQISMEGIMADISQMRYELMYNKGYYCSQQQQPYLPAHEILHPHKHGSVEGGILGTTVSSGAGNSPTLDTSVLPPLNWIMMANESTLRSSYQLPCTGDLEHDEVHDSRHDNLAASCNKLHKFFVVMRVMCHMPKDRQTHFTDIYKVIFYILNVEVQKCKVSTSGNICCMTFYGIDTVCNINEPSSSTRLDEMRSRLAAEFKCWHLKARPMLQIVRREDVPLLYSFVPNMAGHSWSINIYSQHSSLSHTYMLDMLKVNHLTVVNAVMDFDSTINRDMWTLFILSQHTDNSLAASLTSEQLQQSIHHIYHNCNTDATVIVKSCAADGITQPPKDGGTAHHHPNAHQQQHPKLLEDITAMDAPIGIASRPALRQATIGGHHSTTTTGGGGGGSTTAHGDGGGDGSSRHTTYFTWKQQQQHTQPQPLDGPHQCSSTTLQPHIHSTTGGGGGGSSSSSNHQLPPKYPPPPAAAAVVLVTSPTVIDDNRSPTTTTTTAATSHRDIPPSKREQQSKQHLPITIAQQQAPRHAVHPPNRNNSTPHQQHNEGPTDYQQHVNHQPTTTHHHLSPQEIVLQVSSEVSSQQQQRDVTGGSRHIPQAKGREGKQRAAATTGEEGEEGAKTVVAEVVCWRRGGGGGDGAGDGAGGGRSPVRAPPPTILPTTTTERPQMHPQGTVGHLKSSSSCNGTSSGSIVAGGPIAPKGSSPPKAKAHNNTSPPPIVQIQGQRPHNANPTHHSHAPRPTVSKNDGGKLVEVTVHQQERTGVIVEQHHQQGRSLSPVSPIIGYTPILSEGNSPDSATQTVQSTLASFYMNQNMKNASHVDTENEIVSDEEPEE